MSVLDPRDPDSINAVPLPSRRKPRHDGVGRSIPIRQLQRELASPRQRAEIYCSRDENGNVNVCHLGGHDRVTYRSRGLAQASEELQRAGQIHAWVCYGGDRASPNAQCHWHVELLADLNVPPTFHQPGEDVT